MDVGDYGFIVDFVALDCITVGCIVFIFPFSMRVPGRTLFGGGMWICLLALLVWSDLDEI